MPLKTNIDKKNKNFNSHKEAIVYLLNTATNEDWVLIVESLNM